VEPHQAGGEDAADLGDPLGRRHVIGMQAIRHHGLRPAALRCQATYAAIPEVEDIEAHLR